MFYANGTLTKYSVIDVDAAATAAGQGVSLADASGFIKPNASRATGQSRLAPAAAPVTSATASNAPSKVVSSYFRKPDAVMKPSPAPSVSSASRSVVSPQDVSDVVASTTSDAAAAPVAPAAKKRVVSVMVDDDVSSDSSEDEILRSGSRHTKKKSKFRAIVESDDDVCESESGNDDDNAGGNAADDAIAIDSDVSSPRNDDEHSKVELKQERSAGAASWMAAYAKGSRERDRSGWRSVSDLKDKRKDTSKGSSSSSAVKAWRKRPIESDGDEESEDEQHSRTHDEVGQLLHECAQIAQTLRETIKSWSSGSSTTAATPVDDDADEQVSIAAIASDSASDRRIVTQDDIPHLCETLVLKPYQVVGINWLLLLCENGVSGVLADEMGLGKTVQTIAFLQLLDHLAKTQHDVSSSAAGPHLVVVPASVLSNWKREFAWIAPTLRVVVYHGDKNERYDLHDALTPDAFDVLLTTYSYFERDSCQDERAFLRTFHFGYMILDEGHSIKNAKTSRFKRISQMRTRTRLVLSGTPIQNSLNELLSLLSFLQPRMFDHGSDELLTFFDGSEQKKCAKVRKILAPFILRREKANVLTQLVPKTVHVKMLALSDTQRAVYDGVIAAVIAQKERDAARAADDRARESVDKRKFSRQVQALLGLDDARSAKPQKKKPTAAAAKGATLDVVTRLRKAANHPMLLRNHYRDDATVATLSRCLHRAEAFGTQCTIAMVQKELETYSDFALHDLCVQYSANDELRELQLPMTTLLTSAKFDYLQSLLPTLHADGHRVLIFSQWTKVLDLLEVLMSHMDYRYLRLDGSTDVAERQGLIDTYNNDTEIFVFLLSTRAGGLGINLTAADTVILHDLDFNPTNDEQACDRCHRIGQTKPVTIYKLIAENTVDHDIYKVGETKTQLNHAVLGKLNAHAPKTGAGRGSAIDSSTLEMMLASVISNYQKSET